MNYRSNFFFKLMNMNILCKIVFLFSCFLFILPGFSQEINRDSHSIDLQLDSHGSLFYSISYNGKKVIENSRLGVVMSNKEMDFSENLSFIKKETREVNETYYLPTGKQSKYRNVFEETSYTYQNKQGNILIVKCRKYDDGIAFRYVVENKGDMTITQETTHFKIPGETVSWMMDYLPNYENFYPERLLDTIQHEELSFPALLKIEKVWMLLTEASVYNQPATHLYKTGNGNELKIVHPQKSFTVSDQWKSPWRTFIMGKDLATIVESVMVENLNPPSEIEDLGWIKPGVAVFPWWGDYLANSSIETLKEYVDLAAEMNWEWIEFDVSLVGSPWRTSKLWETTDWLPEFTKYAKSKGIKVYGWDEINVLNTPEGRKHVYSRYQELGIDGIKIDYIDTDEAYAMKFRNEALKDAAKYKFMVSFHGETMPRGQRRKWPNVMTLEGVRGAEYYTFEDSEPPNPTHNVTLPFTRNVVGPMDYTPVTFTIREENPRITTYAHELALPIIFESGWTVMADRPKAYLNSPAKEMLQQIEVAWDETKFIDGYPGEFICLARRKGDKWYLAAINANEERTLRIPLDFIQKGEYSITLYEDNPEKPLTDIKIRKMQVNKDDVITVKLNKNGGFSTIIPGNK